MAHNELYQYSIVSALMDGVASHGIPIARVLEHGDHGLGTFQHMVGEMIVLNGEVYQMKADGSVTHITDTEGTLTPFAAVIRFRPMATTMPAKTSVTSKAGLQELLTSWFPMARNHFLAYVMGLNVSGDHFHFIDEGRQCGGHILDLESDGDLDFELALMHKFHVELPGPTEDHEFNGAELKLQAEGIKKVEG
ncbi:hypothetical protein N0V88_006339 [Collariella sp. IMI 366227]|nr:hypothetical protein N0V88_006339 [Collariella sp. IMI 366227]